MEEVCVFPESELAQSEDRFLGSLAREQASVPDVSYHLHWTRAGRDLRVEVCSSAPLFCSARLRMGPEHTPKQTRGGRTAPAPPAAPRPGAPQRPSSAPAPPAGPPQRSALGSDLSAEGQLGGGGGQA